MAGLDPTVQGALIGGGAAVIGFAASAWNTRVTVRANRNAAHDQRVWEKRAPLYEQLLALSPDLGTHNAGAAALEVMANLRPQVLAYASDKVRHAYSALVTSCSWPSANSNQIQTEAENLIGLVRNELQPSEQRFRQYRPSLWEYTHDFRAIRIERNMERQGRRIQRAVAQAQAQADRHERLHLREVMLMRKGRKLLGRRGLYRAADNWAADDLSEGDPQVGAEEL
jgi:hypothetical protein